MLLTADGYRPDVSCFKVLIPTKGTVLSSTTISCCCHILRHDDDSFDFILVFRFRRRSAGMIAMIRWQETICLKPGEKEGKWQNCLVVEHDISMPVATTLWNPGRKISYFFPREKTIAAIIIRGAVCRRILCRPLHPDILDSIPRNQRLTNDSILLDQSVARRVAVASAPGLHDKHQQSITPHLRCSWTPCSAANLGAVNCNPPTGA
ncbi:hypothetical protein J3E69DRAFT_87040 [Trichoderma sp. SZMC 28015]